MTETGDILLFCVYIVDIKNINKTWIEKDLNYI